MMTLEEHAAENRARGDFPLEPKVMSTTYAIEIPVDKFRAIMQYEANGLHYGAEGPTLLRRLDQNSEVENIEYDGFFGCYLYYTLDKKNDNEAEHAKIVGQVNKFIEEALDEVSKHG